MKCSSDNGNIYTRGGMVHTPFEAPNISGIPACLHLSIQHLWTPIRRQLRLRRQLRYAWYPRWLRRCVMHTLVWARKCSGGQLTRRRALPCAVRGREHPLSFVRCDFIYLYRSPCRSSFAQPFRHKFSRDASPVSSPRLLNRLPSFTFALFRLLLAGCILCL